MESFEAPKNGENINSFTERIRKLNSAFKFTVTSAGNRYVLQFQHVLGPVDVEKIEGALKQRLEEKLGPELLARAAKILVANEDKARKWQLGAPGCPRKAPQC